MQHAVPCHVSCASLVMQSLKKWEQLVEVLNSDDVLLGQSWRRRNCRRRWDWAEVVLRVQCQFTRIGSSGFALHEPTIVDGESCAKSVPRCKIILNLLQSACRTVLAASPFPFPAGNGVSVVCRTVASINVSQTNVWPDASCGLSEDSL